MFSQKDKNTGEGPGPAHTTPEEFKNATMTGHFGFALCLRTLGQGNHMIIVTPGVVWTLPQQEKMR